VTIVERTAEGAERDKVTLGGGGGRAKKTGHSSWEKSSVREMVIQLDQRVDGTPTLGSCRTARVTRQEGRQWGGLFARNNEGFAGGGRWGGGRGGRVLREDKVSRKKGGGVMGEGEGGAEGGGEVEGVEGGGGEGGEGEGWGGREVWGRGKGGVGKGGARSRGGGGGGGNVDGRW